MKISNFHVSWDNHLRFKDEVDPFYHSETGIREVVSLGKTISYRIVLEDGTVIENHEDI